jgi:hypothetical protein
MSKIQKKEKNEENSFITFLNYFLWGINSHKKKEEDSKKRLNQSVSDLNMALIELNDYISNPKPPIHHHTKKQFKNKP